LTISGIRAFPTAAVKCIRAYPMAAIKWCVQYILDEVLQSNSVKFLWAGKYAHG
jgi:hypothetical protein